MNQPELSLILIREIHCVTKQAGTLGYEIDGAK